MQEYEQWPGVLSAHGMGVLDLDLRQMGKKAQIDTVNSQWWEGREIMSREKHMAGL